MFGSISLEEIEGEISIITAGIQRVHIYLLMLVCMGWCVYVCVRERFFKHRGLKAYNVLQGVVAKILLFLGLYDVEGRKITLPQSPLQFFCA